MDCVTKVEFDDHREVFSNMQKDLSFLRNDFTKSLEVSDQISKAQLHQSARITSVENSIAGKLDRSECDHLTSLVAKVSLYDAFKNESTLNISKLQQFQNDALDRFGTQDLHFMALDNAVDYLSVEVRAAATKNEFSILSEKTNQLTDSIKLFASKASLIEVGLYIYLITFFFKSL